MQTLIDSHIKSWHRLTKRTEENVFIRIYISIHLQFRVLQGLFNGPLNKQELIWLYLELLLTGKHLFYIDHLTVTPIWTNEEPQGF